MMERRIVGFPLSCFGANGLIGDDANSVAVDNLAAEAGSRP